MYLYVLPELCFNDFLVFPEPDKQQARVRMVIQGSKHPVELSLKAESFNSDIPHRVPEITQTFSKNDLKDTLEMVLPMG